MTEQSTPCQPGEHVVQFSSPCQFGSHEHKPVVLLQSPLLKHGASGPPGQSCWQAFPQCPLWHEHTKDSLKLCNKRINYLSRACMDICRESYRVLWDYDCNVCKDYILYILLIRLILNNKKFELTFWAEAFMSAHLMECRRDGSTTAACLVLDTENAITQAIGLVSCNLLKVKTEANTFRRIGGASRFNNYLFPECCIERSFHQTALKTWQTRVSTAPIVT